VLAAHDRGHRRGLARGAGCRLEHPHTVNRAPLDRVHDAGSIPTEGATVANIDVTALQARAIAELAADHGALALHQITPGEGAPHAGDVYATPHGSDSGFRIAVDGATSAIGHTLPATD
jgi:hypothetical protein